MEIRDRAVLPPEVVERRARAAEEHRRRLLALARSRIHSPEDAEDIVAEALLRALEFDDLNEDLLPNFLTTVTVRLCADLHAKRSVAVRHQHRLLAPPHEPGPEETVCDRSEAEWVAGIVATLPSRQRDVLEARADGESCEAIAQRYRMSYKAVESTLSRARATIRTAFATSLGLTVLVRHRRVVGVTTVVAASATGIAFVVAPHSGSVPPPFPVRSPDVAVALLPTEESSADPSQPPTQQPDPEPVEPSEQRDPDASEVRPTPTYTFAQLGDTQAYTYDDGYKTGERVFHCLEYGVDPNDRHLCPYPPG